MVKKGQRCAVAELKEKMEKMSISVIYPPAQRDFRIAPLHMFWGSPIETSAQMSEKILV